MTSPEKTHIISAFAFELAKVETAPVRLWMRGQSADRSITPKIPVTLQGRKIGVLVTGGFDSTLLRSLQQRAEVEKASVAVIAPGAGGTTDSTGMLFDADFPISCGPSTLFDAVVILASHEGAQYLATQAAAVDWVSTAFAHLKVIGHTPEAQPLLDRAGVKPDEGILPLPAETALSAYITTAKRGRLWERECALRIPGYTYF